MVFPKAGWLFEWLNERRFARIFSEGSENDKENKVNYPIRRSIRYDFIYRLELSV